MISMKKLLSIGVLLITAFTLTACAPTRTIENINSAPITTKASLSEVTKVIQNACHERGWTTSVKRPGLIIAHLQKGTSWWVTTEISYSTKSYSIRYLDSKNLDAQNGRIHFRYNRWISYLNQDIHTGLMKLHH